jgi:hypothetical protein
MFPKEPRRQAGGCSPLVYLIARQISNSCSIGLLAMVLFTFSPISLTEKGFSPPQAVLLERLR